MTHPIARVPDDARLSWSDRAPAKFFAAIVLAITSTAAAQEEFTLPWNTIDCGGGQSVGDEFEVAATIAQPDAGTMMGPEGVETFSIVGGFWGNLPGGVCYANCDNSTAPPVLNALDFACFLTKYAAEDPFANCDESTGVPLLNALDFACFLTKFAAGCS